MIFNVGAVGTTDADKIKYGDSNVEATLDNLNESVDELNESLENLEKASEELEDLLPFASSIYPSEDLVESYTCTKDWEVIYVLVYNASNTVGNICIVVNGEIKIAVNCSRQYEGYALPIKLKKNDVVTPFHQHNGTAAMQIIK